MTTIRDCYIQCSGSFSRLIKSLGISTTDSNNRIPLKGIANEYSRFDIYCSALTVLSTLVADDLIIGERPLVKATQPRFDRQRDNDSDRSSVTSSAESSSSDEADMMTPERQIAALYESITNSVRHLYSLAMVIRKPVATDRLSRASKITVDHFFSFDQRHVGECFPHASPALKKRLAKAITRRRQLLIYNEQHYRKSSEPQPSEETTVTGHVAQDEPREKAEQEMPLRPVTSDPIQHLVRDTPSYAPTISKGSLLASTEATKFIPPVDMREEPDVQSESGTITTFGFTGKDRIALRVPPRPQDDNGEALEQFLCPLCYHLIEVRGERAWMRHVFRDLQAYVCTFDNCETPDDLFETRQDWLRHEFENHRREWHCNDPEHKPFNKKSDIAKLTEIQFNKATDSILTKVTPWLISLPDDFTTDGNPIPDSAERSHQAHPSIGDRGPCLILSSDLKRHIGQHLERLALFALNRSKLMPDDGNSAHTEDAAARSETSFESLQSGNSVAGYGYRGHDPDVAVALKMNVTFADLATYQAWHYHQMSDGVDEKLEDTRRLIEKTLIESVFTDQRPTSHYLTSKPSLFSPEGSLEDLITMESVLSAVCNTGERPNSIDPETFKYTVIYTKAIGKKLFSILVLSGLEGVGLWHAMDFFNKNNICDKNLPLEESDLRHLSNYLYELGSQDDTRSSDVDDLRRKEPRNLWNSELIDSFCNQHQWKFCAPVFSTEKTLELRHQHEKSILPFTEKCTEMDEDSYGQAIKYKIHRQHLVSNGIIQNPVYVTVTRLSFEPMWQDELDKLKRIQSLNQRHIVKLITTFRRGEKDFYFTSEASDAGNVRDFWKTFPRVLTAKLVRSVTEQLHGLVSASFEVGLTTALMEVDALVSNHNLNPENILWFKEGNGADHKVGTMKTCHQSGATELVSTRSLSAQIYTPPEQRASAWNMMVYPDDMWAMGCITLEFMIWLLYGYAGLSKFHQDMEPGLPELDTNRHFWQSSPNGSNVHPVVLDWMSHMAKDPVCKVGQTALGDLLKFTRDRLLVVNVFPRSNFGSLDFEDDISPAREKFGNDQLIDNPTWLQKLTDDSVVKTSPELWNKHRGLITRLYVQENKRLDEIKEFMETGNNFHASTRKYQQQLDKWLFDEGTLSSRVLAQTEAKWESESIKRHRARPKEATPTRCHLNISNESGASAGHSTTTSNKNPPVAISARYRCAWPTLRPLPLQWSRTKFPAHVNPDPSIFENGVYEILERHNIDSGESTVELYMREQQGFPITALPTVLVTSPWSEALRGTWKSITEAIAKSTSPDTGIQGEDVVKLGTLILSGKKP
ncbi:serine threonine kinase [Fusarium circinatum]|uniref:Serine threonine kinase n=1 Tax=Fusarium circinatum TaxID=48490 RepID=A0A8H5TEI9_FUSCI|nr:serine threonine kinase [Fusarium circinatum]